MKQTAVEFLHSEYKRIFADVIVTPEQVLKMADALAQAKEMEKQQIIDACIYGQNNHTVFITADMEIAEQYYNEQFKNK